MGAVLFESYGAFILSCYLPLSENYCMLNFQATNLCRVSLAAIGGKMKSFLCFSPSFYIEAFFSGRFQISSDTSSIFEWRLFERAGI